MMKRKMRQLKRLHRTERALWIVILTCVFILFKMGIEIEYLGVKEFAHSFVHTSVIVVTLLAGQLQVLTISKIADVESEVF